MININVSNSFVFIIKSMIRVWVLLVCLFCTLKSQRNHIQFEIQIVFIGFSPLYFIQLILMQSFSYSKMIKKKKTVSTFIDMCRNPPHPIIHIAPWTMQFTFLVLTKMAFLSV